MKKFFLFTLALVLLGAGCTNNRKITTEPPPVPMVAKPIIPTASGCAIFGQATFRSVQQGAGGLDTNGQPTSMYEQITFNQGKFLWAYSDSGDFGKYICSEQGKNVKLDLTFSSRTKSTTSTAIYDSESRLLHWDKYEDFVQIQ